MGHPVTPSRFAHLSPIHNISDELQNAVRFIHISDTHVDPYFDPAQSMKPGVCHSCQFNSKIYGANVYCPEIIPGVSVASDIPIIQSGYAFGRYGCNPPSRLLHSLLHEIERQDPNPDFIVFTGDIAPHGFPDDTTKVSADTKLSDLCPTKLVIFRNHIKAFRKTLPNTKWIFTMGNNDHFPKNTFWQPYITALGDMFLEEGWITEAQHATFVSHASYFTDVDNVRFISLDLTLFSAKGETSFTNPATIEGLEGEERERALYPVREKTIKWFKSVLEEARKEDLSVHIVGHQPLATKKGKDELEIEGLHFGELKNLLGEYAGIIDVGYFGHRNVAGIQEILGPVGRPIIPSITVPGVSPRGKNQPSFNVVYMDPKTGTILEFEQWIFNLMDENAKIRKMDESEAENYYGEWRQHHHDVYSWRSLSNEQEFTADSLARALHHIPSESAAFFAIEVWKKAGYIGAETPENYQCKSQADQEYEMMTCLFPHQDPECWDSGWLA